MSSTGGLGQLLSRGVVDVGHLGHEQERRCPTGAVDPRSARASADSRRPCRYRPAPSTGRRAGFVGPVNPSWSGPCSRCLWSFSLRFDAWRLNSFRIGPRSKPCVAKAWPPQFSPDSIRYSETQSPRLGEKFSLDHGRVIVTHLQDNLFLALSGVVGKEIFEGGRVGIKAGG